jgi:hypothetical protein
MKTGNIIKTLSIAMTTESGFVQFCDRQLAFQGVLLLSNLTLKNDFYCPGDDVTVLDMTTWEIILRVGADLGYSKVREFQLQKEGIVFQCLQNDCEIVMAPFWI